MTAGLETFAKVRTLHDRTDNPGEKAAAAGRMEALARSAGMTVAEAVSKLDAAPARPDADLDWSTMWEAVRRAQEAGQAADAPDAPSRRRGLPIYDPNKVESWRDVAWNCLSLDWDIPKACGGRFLTKDERARLKVVARYGPVTNATADWIETVLDRCQAAREVWCNRGRKDGTYQARRTKTESANETVAKMQAAAKEREASKMDAPRQQPQPRPQGPAQDFAESFAAFMNRPEFVAERQEREARRRVEAAEIIERHGSEDAVFADTPMEAALRAACEPLLGPGETWETSYGLDGWGSLATRHQMPASVREAATQAWPMPETVAAAWAENEATERLTRERCTVEYTYEPHLFTEARRNVVEEILNTAPARSLNDLRARGAWLDFWATREVSQSTDEHRTVIATLRADIERMGQRLREQDAGPVQNGRAEGDTATAPPLSSPDPGTSTAPVQNGHPRRQTRAERHAAIRALLAEGLTDREVARRLAISPTTVGSIRKARP